MNVRLFMNLASYLKNLFEQRCNLFFTYFFPTLNLFFQNIETIKKLFNKINVNLVVKESEKLLKSSFVFVLKSKFYFCCNLVLQLLLSYYFFIEDF